MSKSDYDGVYIDSLFFSVLHDLYEDKGVIGLIMLKFQVLSNGEKSKFLEALDKCDADSERRDFISENLFTDTKKQVTLTTPHSNNRKYNSIEELFPEVRPESMTTTETEAIVATVIETKPNKKKFQSMEKLDSLVGLEKVKRQINELIALTEITRLRGQHNLKSDKQGLHMIFKGNPGTGKTTVARLLGKILHEIGVLEKGHVVEIDRSSVVSMYQGEIERKMSEFVEEAEGGILFIDEIYSLFNDQKGEDQGRQGINTLLKLIEDKRDKFICIGAGYNDEVDELLGSNPGLKSRFSIHLDFEDYTEDQLLKIADDMFKNQDYLMNEDFKDMFVLCIEEEKDTKNFGNGRVVRNIVESAIRTQSIRLFNSDQDLNKDDLTTIIGEDFKYQPVVLNNEAS